MRGHVTHVIDRNRRYVESFDALVEFISSYLVNDMTENDPEAPR